MLVRLADSPLTCVVTGAGEALAEPSRKKGAGNTQPPVPRFHNRNIAGASGSAQRLLAEDEQQAARPTLGP